MQGPSLLPEKSSEAERGLHNASMVRSDGDGRTVIIFGSFTSAAHLLDFARRHFHAAPIRRAA
jgi:quinol monooxygenase YgiN